ncbi:unnamed protein product [Withania somnifera]
MPRKGMRTLNWFSPKRQPSDTHLHFAFSPSRPSFSEALIDRTIEMNRQEAKDFIKYVNNLHKAMHFHATENSTSDKLVRAQSLMHIAMKRLRRMHLDPESVSSRTSTSTRSKDFEFNVEDDLDGESIFELEDFSSIIMADLRLIAEFMRKSIIDEAIYRLGVEKWSSSRVHKLQWEVVDLKIKDWLNTVDRTMKTWFRGERILCDYVFASNDAVRESCFTEISKDGAMILFSFPEIVAKNSKKSPEKVFRLLDMYTSISGRLPEIEATFSSVIRSQALTSLVKLGESIRTALGEFETALQKESSKTIIAGGGIHRLTMEAMDFLILFADYSNVISDILVDSPPPAKGSFPESYFGMADFDESPAPAMSLRFAWLIVILLCKLDGKATQYKDVSLAYLFLVNNLQYIIVKVRSSNLRYLLGENWIAKQEGKIKQLAFNYERLGWSHVIESLQHDPNASMTPQQVKEIFKKFNSWFEQANKKQSTCIVPNSKLRDDLKMSISRKILPLYTQFYNKYREVILKDRHSSPLIRFSPKDVQHHLSVLFSNPMEAGTSSSSPSPSPLLTTPSPWPCKQKQWFWNSK